VFKALAMTKVNTQRMNSTISSERVILQSKYPKHEISLRTSRAINTLWFCCRQLVHFFLANLVWMIEYPVHCSFQVIILHSQWLHTKISKSQPWYKNALLLFMFNNNNINCNYNTLKFSLLGKFPPQRWNFSNSRCTVFYTPMPLLSFLLLNQQNLSTNRENNNNNIRGYFL